MWEVFLARAIRREAAGHLFTVHLPSGRVLRPSTGAETPFEVALHGKDAARRLCLNPPLAFGELYTEGKIELLRGELVEVIEALLPPRGGPSAPTRRFSRWRNPPETSRHNVEHHYDLGNDFYRLFLDEDLQYSCAYWGPGVRTLEEAQEAKKRHIAEKLLIKPGMRVLDVGCGWGGMALTLARDYGAEVTGITLSPSQLAHAEARAERAGLSGRVRFLLTDYREIEERFDRVVSVGMLEHVGPRDLPVYFRRLAQLLEPDGAALVHSIGRAGPPRQTSPWIKKYIFPGGHLPALSDLASPLESSGLWLTDLEVLRLHYAKTLRAWRERFEQHADHIEREKGEDFVRLWRFYLCGSEAAFTAGDQVVFQLQLAASREVVPLTRDYLYTDKVPEASGAEAA
ncbi:SAM-dependent methyltransferase [Parvularcula lutaonensis]|uniref:Class I SAM-dependent methyltransferase n=1 Tax=Parvularcula lutaonensis TaxID=491923 RepID=A0ABV7M8L3_9PROT|nr:cyclopropane-fatty-acyl-phospholipid synthase family protein [Parvularcula lutaonensis]GGY41327.1 cyclopropane-fatty-acyl-phospholipid synthase [Parvularcula lutaonensis]